MKTKFLTMLMVASLGLSACMENTGNKELMGSMGGAVLGGIAGAQFGKGTGQLVGVGAGALLGGLLGSELGKSLDRADLAYANQAQQQAYAAPVGQAISWNNPDTGNSGTIVPTRDGYQNTSGRYCREYSQTIYVDGKQQTGVGSACQNPDGSWQIVN